MYVKYLCRIGCNLSCDTFVTLYDTVNMIPILIFFPLSSVGLNVDFNTLG